MGGEVFTLHVQFNLSTTASLGTEESGRCREVAASQPSTEIFWCPFFLAYTYFFLHPRLYTFSPPTTILELSSLLLYVFPPGQLPRSYTFLIVCPKYFFVEFQD